MLKLIALCSLLVLVASTTEWHDVRDLGVRGRGFDANELESFADRLPMNAKWGVRNVIWTLSTNSAGLYVDFITNSSTLWLNRTYNADTYTMWHFPSSGMAGLDLFQWDNSNDTWRWAGVTQKQTQRVEIEQITGLCSGTRKFRLHFPLYNGLESLFIGIESESTITPAPYEYKSRPILWYGTSITQGGVVSRPGFAFTNHIRRNIKREVLNFGFSGSCLMEENVTNFLVDVKPTPAIFVIDCEWNMDPASISQRAVPLVKQIRSALPNTPIILAESTTSGPAWTSSSAAEVQRQRWEALWFSYKYLVNEGMDDLHYVYAGELYRIEDDPRQPINPTVGGIHPSDLGHYAMTQFYTKFLPTILKEDNTTLKFPEAFGGKIERNRNISKIEMSEPLLNNPSDIPDDLVYTDVELELGVMNRPFNNTERYYNRLPKTAKGVVSDAVYSLSQFNTGMAVHFITNATVMYLNYSVQNDVVPLWHMPNSGVSGADLFRYDENLEIYRAVHCLQQWSEKYVVENQIMAITLPPVSARYALYLPLRNEFLNLSVAVPRGSTVIRDPHYSTDSVTAYGKKPIVWYGTSIDQGGVASRPGTTYTNILSRNLKRQVLNYGFAGNGLMETSVMEFLAQIDAGLFVIDCLPNMSPHEVTQRTQPLYHFIRSFEGGRHASTPLLFVAGTNKGSYWCDPAINNNKRTALENQIDIIKRETNDSNLHLFLNEENELFDRNFFINPTVDGTHPSDLGHREIARYYTRFLPQFLRD